MIVSVPIFAGHGTSAIYSALVYQQAQRDAAIPQASVFLSACHEVLHRELSSLSPDELVDADVELADFTDTSSLLAGGHARYTGNPIISGSFLYVTQMLRYIGHSTSLSTFGEALKNNAKLKLGALGFSSGIIPACIIASSFDTPSFLSHAVEGYKLVLWLGIRTQFYRTNILRALRIEPDLPWGYVLIGTSHKAVQSAISAFHSDASSLHISAIVADGHEITVSGRPDLLKEFITTLPADVIVHPTTLNTLYHSPLHTRQLQADLLADVARRPIRFPTLAECRIPVIDTATGHILTEKPDSLVERVIDMILCQRVDWDAVLARLHPDDAITIVNFGPGSGLAKSTERSLKRVTKVSLVDCAPGSRSALPVKPKREPVAIVGMAVNMPGGANTPEKLWNLLESGINTISEIPEHRFNVTDYTRTGNKTPHRAMKAHTGNFLDGVDEFDNEFFRISPREAKSMDPQQRLLLHATHEALEDAGYVPGSTKTWDPETFGCFVGVATHDYVQNLRNDIDVYYSTGTLKAFLSGRLSYANQMSGPSVVVDTACSSSIVAVYQGVRALQSGDCDAALVGGVNVISSPDMFIGLDRGHFLSPTGQCTPFDASADGYSRSEGVGMFVIKRLCDAIQERDNILGVITGVDVNQSGLAHSITHPHPPTQARLFRRVLESAGIGDVGDVGVVEAHGTGTQAGDPAELESIRSVLASPTRNLPLYITSIKANIGHLEAASGAAGLAKLLLMLKHRRIPPQISLRDINPRIKRLGDDNVVIPTEEGCEWGMMMDGGRRRRRIAMLNNFGAAGTNTALVLEEYNHGPSSAAAAAVSQPQPYPHPHPLVFGLSAKTCGAVEKMRDNLVEWLNNPVNNDTPLNNVAYTTTARRQIYPHRIAVCANSREDLLRKLHTATPVLSNVNVNVKVKVKVKVKVVFVFSGQGGQYLGMGKSLYETCTVFRQCIDECEGILTRSGFPSILPIIMGENADGSVERLDEFQAYQGAVVSLECALVRVWGEWGVRPDAVIGHSLGEYAALVAAGVLSLRDALMVVGTRARLMVQKCAVDASGMLAVNLEPVVLQEEMRSQGLVGVSIACFNGPKDCVVSGSIEELKRFKGHCDDVLRCKSTILRVPFGYHSSAMKPLLSDLISISHCVSYHPPTIPVVSAVLGKVVPAGESTVFGAAYFAMHCELPVKFDAGIDAALSSETIGQGATWIGIGPHPSELSMIKSNSHLSEGAVMLPSLRKQQDSWETLMGSLAKLYLSDVPVRWRSVFAHEPSVSCVSLPTYPFTKRKFWVKFKEDAAALHVSASSVPSPPPPAVHTIVQHPTPGNDHTIIIETPLEHFGPAIEGHKVGGFALCPASVYLDYVVDGLNLGSSRNVQKTLEENLVFRNVEFVKPLVYVRSGGRTVVLTLSVGHHDSGLGNFTVSSRSDDDDAGPPSVHVHGEYRLRTALQTVAKLSRSLSGVNRAMAALLNVREGSDSETFSARTLYENIFPRVVQYSPQYRSVKSITVAANGMEACARVELPDVPTADGVLGIQTVFTDTLLHVPGFVSNLSASYEDAYICNGVGSVKILTDAVSRNGSYLVYCSNVVLPEEDAVLCESFAVRVGEPNRIVAHMKDMCFRRVRLRSLTSALGRTTTTTTTKQALSPARPSNVRSKTVPVRSPALESNYPAGYVVQIISSTCDIPPSSISLDTDLDSLGVDSLMFIEILGQLKSTFTSADIDSRMMSHCHFVRDVVALVESKAHDPLQLPTPATTPRLTQSPKKLQTSTPSPSELCEIIAGVTGMEPEEINGDADWDSLGLDSLASIEAVHALRGRYGVDMSQDIFVKFTTLNALEAYLQSNNHHAGGSSAKGVDAASASETSLTRIARAFRLETIPNMIQKPIDPCRLPLFLVHDGSGLAHYFDRLGPVDRALWAIHNPHFVSSEPWRDVAHMASTYADYITRTHRSGPVLIGGWSFGGVIAYEVALQLSKRGVSVGGIVLIDAPDPINHVPLSATLIDSLLSHKYRTMSSDVEALVKTQFRQNSNMLREYSPFGTKGGVCPPIAFLRSSEGYSHPSVPDIPLWLSDRTDPRQAIVGWTRIAPAPPHVIDIPGNHFEAFHPEHSEQLTIALREACAFLEKTEPPVSH